jgi:hypothetical protein
VAGVSGLDIASESTRRGGGKSVLPRAMRSTSRRLNNERQRGASMYRRQLPPQRAMVGRIGHLIHSTSPRATSRGSKGSYLKRRAMPALARPDPPWRRRGRRRRSRPTEQLRSWRERIDLECARPVLHGRSAHEVLYRVPEGVRCGRWHYYHNSADGLAHACVHRLTLVSATGRCLSLAVSLYHAAGWRLKGSHVMGHRRRQ